MAQHPKITPYEFKTLLHILESLSKKVAREIDLFLSHVPYMHENAVALGVFGSVFEDALDKSNRNLKNERAVHFIAGTSAYLSNDLKLAVESYYKKIDNLLVRTNRYVD